MHEKPPKGVMPRFLWEESRVSELSRGMESRIEACLTVPPEWVEEYNELIVRVKDAKKKRQEKEE